MIPYDTTNDTIRVRAPAKRIGLLAMLVTGFRALWRARGLWLGLVAIGCGLYGQNFLAEHKVQLIPLATRITFATRWYTLAIILAILAWLGTYRNRSSLSWLTAHLPTDASTRTNEALG